MTIDADDITYQVKSSEAAGRRLMKDRNSGLVFWVTPEGATAAELQNGESAPVVSPEPDMVEFDIEAAAAVAGRELLPEFLRKEPKRRAPRKRPVNGA